MSVMKIAVMPVRDPSRQFQCGYGYFVEAPSEDFFKKYGRMFRDPKGPQEKPRTVQHPNGTEVPLDQVVIIQPAHWENICKEEGIEKEEAKPYTNVDPSKAPKNPGDPTPGSTETPAEKPAPKKPAPRRRKKKTGE